MKKLLFIILLGLCVVLSCIVIYHAIQSVVLFHDLSAIEEQASQKLFFYREGNKYIATILVKNEDLLYYLNWFPEIKLNVNGIESLEYRKVISIFLDSKNNKKIHRLDHTNQFTVGPLKRGQNIVELYFEPNLNSDLKVLEGELNFTETGNAALPVVHLGKAILYLLLLLLMSICFYRFRKSFPFGLARVSLSAVSAASACERTALRSAKQQGAIATQSNGVERSPSGD